LPEKRDLGGIERGTFMLGWHALRDIRRRHPREEEAGSGLAGMDDGARITPGPHGGNGIQPEPTLLLKRPMAGAAAFAKQGLDDGLVRLQVTGQDPASQQPGREAGQDAKPITRHDIGLHFAQRTRPVSIPSAPRGGVTPE